MSRRFIAIVFAAALAAVGLVQGSQAAGLPTIYVDYRDDCTFRLTNDAGATVSQVAAGTYQVAVSTGEPFASYNLSAFNDLTACKGSVSFRLTGPGVSVITTLEGGDGAFELHGVVFQAGATYTVQDDHNVAGTRRTFVAAASAPASSPSSSPSTSSSSTSTNKTGETDVEPVVSGLRGSLAGSVTTTGKLALTLEGKPVSTLKSGRYRITVLDETSRTAFKLQRLGKAATTLTTKGYVGRRTVTLTLQRGQWTFYSTPGKKSYFLVTA